MMTASEKQAVILTVAGEVKNETTGETHKVWDLINRAKRRTMGIILGTWNWIVGTLKKVPALVWVFLGTFLAVWVITVVYYVIFFALFMINPVIAYVFEFVWVVGWLGGCGWYLHKAGW